MENIAAHTAETKALILPTMKEGSKDSIQINK
jgi:hypothetical protein